MFDEEKQITIEDLKNLCNVKFYEHDITFNKWFNKKEIPSSCLSNVEINKLSDYENIFMISKYISGSDYGNSCLVELSNYEWFKNVMFDNSIVYDIFGDYGSYAIGFNVVEMLNPDNINIVNEILDILNGLNDYPIINDDLMYEMENDLIKESMSDYALNDYQNGLENKLNIGIFNESVNIDRLESLFYNISEKIREYWINDSASNMYIDIDKLVENTTIKEIKEMLIEFNDYNEMEKDDFKIE